jgi:hypothetical protein
MAFICRLLGHQWHRPAYYRTEFCYRCGKRRL